MSNPIQAFPLHWPAGWRRTPAHDRIRSMFRSSRRELSVMDGVGRVIFELTTMGVAQEDVVISTNIPLRLDGLPKSNTADPLDVGAAVYWRYYDETQCLAIDLYHRVADNLAAIASTLNDLRSIERHGGAIILNRVYQGLTALPAPESWWQVLGLKGPDASEADIRRAHRALISEHHPDTGGDNDMAARVNRARDQGLEAVR